MLYSYSLEPRFDSRNSFYGKATVIVSDGGKILTSYDSRVAKIVNGRITLNESVRSDMLFSYTTLRHLKEFIRQETGLILTKKQLQNEVEKGNF